MNIKLNDQIIKDLCGEVSFKRGDAYVRNGKVQLDFVDEASCRGIVEGKEPFEVMVNSHPDGRFEASCTCPKLTSFTKECQHIAAVLLSLADRKRNHSPQTETISSQHVLTEGLMSLFRGGSRQQPTAHRLHFETRQAVPVAFICEPVPYGTHDHLLGISIVLNGVPITNIRPFLHQIKNGEPVEVSASFTYQPENYCLHRNSDEVVQLLFEMSNDEELLQGDSVIISPHQLMILPSYFRKLLSALQQAEEVELRVSGMSMEGIASSIDPLPLSFHMTEQGSEFRLRVIGLRGMVVMNGYHSVLSRGKIVHLPKDDCQRLYELKKMLVDSKTDEIPIMREQLPYVMDKVVPGLKRLGRVELAPHIRKEFMKTPLVAKLYLDRIKNRLLAAIEFQYGEIVLHPLEEQERKGAAFVVRDLEKEAAVIEIMEESQFAQTEGGYFLQNEELEFDFLVYQLPKLQKLMQIYATTAVRNRIFRESAKPKIRVKVHKERTDWLKFTFEMDGIPEKQIRDILHALQEKRKYYRLRDGSLLSLETREFQEVHQFIHGLPAETADLSTGVSLPIIEGLSSIHKGDEELFQYDPSFRAFLDALSDPGRLVDELPSGLQATLRDYQIQGYQWMKTLASYGFGGILGDDMGLGKTLQSIAYIQSELEPIRKNKQPVLIVCPSSLTYNWLNELMKFSPEIEAIVMDGSPSEREQLQRVSSNMDVLIASYPLVRRDLKWYETQTFHTIFFDEAQAFKNPATQTARAMKKIQSPHRFALTGTPIENSLEELWSIFHVVFPQLFKRFDDYSHLTRKEIGKRIRPFLLRRLKEDVLSELPEKIETMEYIELFPEQKKLYAAYLAKLREETLKHLDKDTIRKNRIKILAGLTRLRQICCHPALFVDGYKGSSAKFEHLFHLLEEAQHSRRRVLVFSQFTGMLQLIGRRLAEEGGDYFYLDGQTPSEERVDLCRRYNDGEADVFLISLKAGGTGLNLTGADTVLLYDIWWNPAVEEQAMDRAHRMGQLNPVQVIKLVGKGTIEESINKLQLQKKDLIDEVIDATGSAHVSITDEELKEMLSDKV
jgi:SNF2 family DNA or RNA helicase